MSSSASVAGIASNDVANPTIADELIFWTSQIHKILKINPHSENITIYSMFISNTMDMRRGVRSATSLTPLPAIEMPFVASHSKVGLGAGRLPIIGIPNLFHIQNTSGRKNNHKALDGKDFII